MLGQPRLLKRNCCVAVIEQCPVRQNKIDLSAAIDVLGSFPYKCSCDLLVRKRLTMFAAPLARRSILGRNAPPRRIADHEKEVSGNIVA